MRGRRAGRLSPSAQSAEMRIATRWVEVGPAFGSLLMRTPVPLAPRVLGTADSVCSTRRWRVADAAASVIVDLVLVGASRRLRGDDISGGRASRLAE